MTNNDNWDSFDDIDEEIGLDENSANSNWDSFDDLEFEDVKLNIPQEKQGQSDSGIQVSPITSKDLGDEDLEEFNEEDYENYDFDDEYENFEDYEDYEEESNDPPVKGGKKKIIPILIAVFSAIALIALIVLISSLIFKSCKDDGEVGANTTVAWEENKNQAINDLVNKYFDARVLADTNTLKSLVDENITINEDSVKNESAMTEAYRDVKCYVTKGINDGEFAVYVTYAVKFKNIDTPAPGLIPFYVKTDSAGNMRLIPWQYIKSNESFTEVQTFIDEVSRCDQITQLSDMVEENYQKALSSDTKLKEYILSIGGDVGETKAPETTAAGGEEGQQEQQAQDEWTTCDEYWYAASENVNVRKEASTDSEVLQTLPTGTKVHVVGKNGDWFKLQLRDGSTAYINKIAVTDVQP